MSCRFILLILCFCTLFSCSDDGDDNKYFYYKTQKYTLNRGYYNYFKNTVNNTRAFDINLCSNSIKLDSFNFEGKGNRILIHLVCPEDTMITGGRYIFNTSREAFSFSGGLFFLNGSFDKGSFSGNTIRITSGWLDITRNKSNFNLNWHFVTENQDSLTGLWVGELKHF